MGWARESLPAAHGFVRTTYWAIRGLRARVGGTALQERFWATRHLSRESDWGQPVGAHVDEWIRGYWESRHHPHRGFLVNAVAKWNPKVVLEVGCNCGPNLYCVAKRLPHAQILGFDINEHAVSEGRRLIAAEGLQNVSLQHGSVDLLETMASQSIDVVFSDATLLYIGPDRIEQVLDDLLRIARKAVVLNEWHCDETEFGKSTLGRYDSGCWRRDYPVLLRSCRRVPKTIQLTRIPAELWPSENWRRWGYLIEAIV